jgi:hypothetical protein
MPLSRLLESKNTFRYSSWGLVEVQHDYDRLNCTVQLHAAVVLSESLAVEDAWL